MVEHIPRLFDSADAIRHIGEGLLRHSLKRPEWTHEAHLAASLWMICERPDIAPERDLPAIIRGFNEYVGGVNDDHQGYHETITQVYLMAIRAHLSECDASGDLVEKVNTLLLSRRGRRDVPFGFYSKDRLLSVDARRHFITPDLRPLSEI